jgi:hypothetical protein
VLEEKYPALAKRMYEKNVRVLMHSQSPIGKDQVGKVCELDRDSLASKENTSAPPRRQTLVQLICTGFISGSDDLVIFCGPPLACGIVL